ncbi:MULTISPECIES: hypothetical protein [Brucella]|uniref:hypothetical protein n=1 Tax=Brucella TaxID=234 RepID=UPI000311AF32
MKAEKGKNAIAYCRRHREKLARFSVGPETNLLRKQKSDFLPSHGKSYKNYAIYPAWARAAPETERPASARLCVRNYFPRLA